MPKAIPNIVRFILIQYDPVQESFQQKKEMPERLYRLYLIEYDLWPQVELREGYPLQLLQPFARKASRDIRGVHKIEAFPIHPI